MSSCRRIERLIATAERRVQRRQAAVDWMVAYRKANNLRQSLSCTRHHCFRLRALSCAHHDAPFPLPPHPWVWYEPRLGVKAFKWVSYDHLLVLLWEAQTTLNRLRVAQAT